MNVNESVYQIIGVVSVSRNGCCPGKPIVITRSRANSNYLSAECICGGWCTGGFLTVEEVLKSYEQMSRGHYEIQL